jgi:hypothetical protein
MTGTSSVHAAQRRMPMLRRLVVPYVPVVGLEAPARTPEPTKEQTVDVIVNLIVILAGFLGLGAAAASWGVDSRDALPDSHAR